MPASTLLLKYAFGAVWLVVLPLGLAWAVIAALSGPPIAVPTGPLEHLLAFVRDQPIPSGIILCTVFEVALWSVRHDLPLSDRLSFSGRLGVPRAVRRDYEAAAQLLDDTQGLLAAKAEAIRSTIPATEVEALRASLERLRAAMSTEPFEVERFDHALDETSARAELLSPWRKSALREYAESIAIALAIAGLLRAVVVEAFKIPSGSMLPTLQIQDHIFVNKLIYGPVIPFTETRLLQRLPPTRGDVIVFEYPDTDPRAERQDYIKRVIAIPGDTLEAIGGHPVLNGWRVPYCNAGQLPDGTRAAVEFLGAYAYLTFFEPRAARGDGRSPGTEGEDEALELREGPYVVKPGEVWVMGDNRDNSHDSRRWFGGRGGGVPFAKIKGRAMFVWFPMSRLFVDVMGSPVLPAGTASELLAGVQRCLATRPSTRDATPPTER